MPDEKKQLRVYKQGKFFSVFDENNRSTCYLLSFRRATQRISSPES
ncbi:hypothetical protein [Nostoc sp. 106C]|nr:hypothetical protein [Nostoc sp. 106C]